MQIRLIKKVGTAIRSGKISLRRSVIIALIGASLLSFVAGHLIASLFFSDVLRGNSLASSRLLFPILKNEILSRMEQGEQDRHHLAEVLTDQEGQALNLRIRIHPGAQLHPAGGLWQQLDDELLRLQLQRGEAVAQEKFGTLTHYYPLPAETACLGCHQQARRGEILGYIELSQDLQALVHGKWTDLLLLLICLAPFPFGMALLVTSTVNRRLKHATDRLHDKIKDAGNIDELTSLDLKSLNLGFVELNLILLQFRKFIHKVKHVAVDREILAFEIRLLEKFIITSAVVKDWKQHIGRLLREINTILPAHTLFSIFKVDDELYDLDIFWRGVPSEAMKQEITAAIAAVLAENDCNISMVGVSVKHTIVDTDVRIEAADVEELALQTKSLIMDAPRIGGVIGIGVQALNPQDPVMALVIDGILTSLLNVVGSVRAIYIYTKELEYYATRDPLTHLYNQRMFWELLDYELFRAMRHEYQFTVLFIDLDNFKRVNDNYGHSFGDQFLVATTRQIRQVLRDGDILTRYGGDELAVILPEIGEEQGYAAAERIRNAIETLALAAPDGSTVKATISIGLAAFPEHAGDAKTLFLVADNMMYKAKKEGKNAIGCPCAADLEDIFRKNEERNSLIYRALDHEELILPYFQPIVAVARNEIQIHELLMRIVDGERVVPAGEFVEQAENLGLMHRFDLILIRKAFQQIQAVGYQGVLFVNISPKSLITGRFIRAIRELAQTYGVVPHNIVFEITERETCKNLNALEKFVVELKNEGFRFAVDDFGSGYSSFQYIKSFSIDFLKIDGEFIACLPYDQTYQAFVKSMVTLAQELGIKTVAEFVETEEILQLVNAFGIDYAQGYHIGRPAENFAPSDPLTDQRSAAANSDPLLPMTRCASLGLQTGKG
ncbi:MAG TPA: bifunctional diguanylate cyclase/phosphodiesterase [Geopsychrobacteraceae bacterium]